MVGAPSQDTLPSFVLRQHRPSPMSEPSSRVSEAPTGKQGRFICRLSVEAKWRDNLEEFIGIDPDSHWQSSI
jgi:hypothetical protein